MSSVNKVVLAYSGGLDTSVIVKWLQEEYQCEVVTFTADIGQGEEVEPARAKAEALGVKEIYIDDLREEYARDYVFPMFRANTIYEGEYLLGTSIARPLIAKRLIEIARETGADAIKLSVNDFILKASAEALRRVPAVNASWAGTSIRTHGAVHLSFGVALEDGLVTPVIRDAHAKTLKDIAVEAKSLIGKARSKKLTPNEMSGSTFTVTNLGMYGVTGFFGIINVPNAAILSVGATIKKPVVDAQDRLVIGHRMVIGLSGDHRVVDGANGAQFLQALKQLLEEPALMLI